MNRLGRIVFFVLVTVPAFCCGFTLLSAWWLTLKFTLPWWTVSLVPVVIAWEWLRRAGNPRGSVFLLICLTLVTAGVVALGRGYFTPYPAVPAGTHEITLEWSMGTLPMIEGFYDLENPAEDTYVLFYQENGDPIDLTIYFPEIEALDGRWTVTQGTIVTDCPESNPDCPTPGAEYAAVTNPVSWELAEIRGEAVQTVKPFLKVDLPLNPAQTHTRLDLRAVGTITYANALGETNDTLNIRREMTVFVGTPAEFQTRIQVNRWRELENMMERAPTARVIYWVTGISALLGLVTLVTITSGAPYRVTAMRRGLRLRPVRSELFGLSINPPEDGAYVGAVMPGTFAEYAGLQAGDVIIRVGGVSIQNPRDFFAELKQTKDDMVPLVVWRYGEYLELLVDFQQAKAKAGH